jgi:anti-sigma factor RsiW
MNNPILEKDLELLSSYLDGQLSLSEEKQVKERLDSDSAFQEAFEKLERTHLILSSLTQLPVPHNFTLSPDLNKKKGYIPSFFQFFRLSSAIATLSLVVLLAIDYFPFAAQQPAFQRVEVVQVPAAAAPVAKSNEPPMIIIWGSSQPEVLGKGGGGGNGQGGANSAYAIPQPDMASPGLSSEMAVPPTQPISPQLAPSLAAPPEDTKAAPETGIGGTGPILGIPPSDERGLILSTPATYPGSVTSEKISAIRIFELMVGAFALLAGIIAFLLDKRQF